MLTNRNREINIFNLSMMDVISGAMGAFLIIVILLSRYYDSDPANKEVVTKLEEELRQALNQVQEGQQMAELNPGDLTSVINKIRAAGYHINQAEDKVKEIEKKLDQAKSHVDRLEDEKEELQRANTGLEARRPFLLQARWACQEGNVDIYLLDSGKSTDGYPMPPFDPDHQQWSYWTGDNYIDTGGTGQGVETWMTLAVYPDISYKLYYKLDQGKETARGCTVNTQIFSRYFKTIEIPEVTLSAKEPWVYAGSFMINEDREIGDFKMATDKERAEEREWVPKLLKEFEPIQAARDKHRTDEKLEDPNAGRTEEKGTNSVKKNKPFWEWWQK